MNQLSPEQIKQLISNVEATLSQLKEAMSPESSQEEQAEPAKMQSPAEEGGEMHEAPDESDVNGGAAAKVEQAAMKKDMIKAMMKKKGY
jgi:hypothetical protein